MKFLLSNEFIASIDGILTVYKELITNKCSVDSIKLLISKWSRSSIPVEVKKNMATNSWRTLRMHDVVCDSIDKFRNIYYDTYLTDKCLRLVQGLIDTYTINSTIVKMALENLLPIIELQSRIDYSSTVSSGRLLTFIKKLKCISLFMKRKLWEIIYREVYFAYLIQSRDEKLLKAAILNDQSKQRTMLSNAEPSKHTLKFESTNSQYIHDGALTTTNVGVDIEFADIQDLVLSTHVTALFEVNSIRAVCTQLCSYYNINKVKKIATENLKKIIQNIFKLNSSEFISLLLQFGAILSGSTTEQCIHDGHTTFAPESNLDIYIPLDKTDATKCFIEFSFNAGYTTFQDTPPVISNETHFLPRNLGYEFFPSINEIIILKNNTTGRKIQIITIDNANGMSTFEFGQFVVSSFDLTFLKNFFDGTNLYVHDFHGVVTKHGMVTPYVAQKCVLNISSLIELKISYYANIATILRVLKNQSRGYCIDNIPEFSLVKQLKL